MASASEFTPLRRKYLMADRRAYDPQVNGDLESRLPCLSLSASPEHGSSKSRPWACVRLRDHTGFVTSGPGQMSTWSSAPSIRQSKYWCSMSPSALNIETFRFVASHVVFMISSIVLTSFLIAAYVALAAAIFCALSVMTVAWSTPTGTLLVERPLHTMCGRWHAPVSA